MGHVVKFWLSDNEKNLKTRIQKRKKKNTKIVWWIIEEKENSKVRNIKFWKKEKVQ